MRKQWLLVLSAAVLMLAGCSALSANAADVIGDPEQGQTIYETGGAAGIPCASCHSLDGSRIVGPSWQGLAERAETRVPGLTAQEYLRQSIVDPSSYVVEGYQDVMPEVLGEKLTEDDIDNVIAFILSLD